MKNYEYFKRPKIILKNLNRFLENVKKKKNGKKIAI